MTLPDSPPATPRGYLAVMALLAARTAPALDALDLTEDGFASDLLIGRLDSATTHVLQFCLEARALGIPLDFADMLARIEAFLSKLDRRIEGLADEAHQRPEPVSDREVDMARSALSLIRARASAVHDWLLSEQRRPPPNEAALLRSFELYKVAAERAFPILPVREQDVSIFDHGDGLSLVLTLRTTRRLDAEAMVQGETKIIHQVMKAAPEAAGTFALRFEHVDAG